MLVSSGLNMMLLISLPLSVSLVVESCLSSISLGWLMGSMSSSLVLDPYSLMFLTLGTHVVASIIIFSWWYMGDEPSVVKFIGLLCVFYFFMLLLVFSGNLLTILVGWEGVGILSFLLISWWWSREEASMSSVQAILYNRIGDFGLYLALFALVITGGSIFLDSPGNMGGVIGLMVMLAAMAKSSQVLFHPWLPNAMEGPTPVSSLLHSSTMVVASVFLLIRVGPMVDGGLEVFVSSLTMMYSSLCAYSQTDFKKIVAFSTTSQLSLMVCTVGMGFTNLAFFHLCMHALFKSLIFMSSGVLIHSSVGSSQDIRGYTGTPSVSFMALLLSSMSLSGFPFMASFYSKDLILENSYGPVLNRMAVVVLAISSVLTVAYSLKLILWSSKGVPLSSYLSALVAGVEVSPVAHFVSRLVLLGVVSGVALFGYFTMVVEEYVSFLLKVMPLLIISLSALLAIMASKVGGLFVFNTGISMSVYNPLMHRLVVSGVLYRMSGIVVNFEYFWWEIMYGGLFRGIMSLVVKLGYISYTGSYRSFYVSFVLALLIVGFTSVYYTPNLDPLCVTLIEMKYTYSLC